MNETVDICYPNNKYITDWDINTLVNKYQKSNVSKHSTKLIRFSFLL